MNKNTKSVICRFVAATTAVLTLCATSLGTLTATYEKEKYKCIYGNEKTIGACDACIFIINDSQEG